MSVRRADPGDECYSDRPSHLVNSPETFLTWHDYAFSDAPELREQPAAAESNPS